MPARRFPPPWSTEEGDNYFVAPIPARASPLLGGFHTKPIFFNRAFRLADILFFLLRCTETQDPSLKFPSQYWIGTRQ